MDKWMAPSSNDAFKHTGENIDFANMSESNLKSNIWALENSIKSASSITRSLHLTNILSLAKNSLTQKEKNIDANNAYWLLASNVKVGDVLLINKRKDTSFGAQALRWFEENNPADYTHSILITGVNPVKFIHSTWHKESWPWSGVEEVNLEYYFKKHKPSDVLVMKQHSPHKENSLKYAKERIGKWYDSKIAAMHGFSWILPTKMINKAANDDEYNCVELIAKSYKNDPKISRFSHPNQFLWNNETFTPSYMTEIV